MAGEARTYNHCIARMIFKEPGTRDDIRRKQTSAIPRRALAPGVPGLSAAIAISAPRH
jgi:hypothetical protein